MRAIVKDDEPPVIVEFPLRGEWMTPNTPGNKIPSHGTDKLGERYAFDFLQVDWNRAGKPFYRSGFLTYLTQGVPLADCYGWGKDVHAPFDGIIVKAEDGMKERQSANLFVDLRVMLKNASQFDLIRDGIQTVAGNFVVIENKKNLYAAFAHLQQGSIIVSSGQRIKKGQPIGKVGHSGNSTAPHLHFQLMDSENMNIAKGIPCAFERYDLYQQGEWKPVYNGVPSSKDRIRFVK
jgi:murein DD-endopeptidase MepM/ murein hydrolase activator NlpD